MVRKPAATALSVYFLKQLITATALSVKPRIGAFWGVSLTIMQTACTLSQ